MKNLIKIFTILAIAGFAVPAYASIDTNLKYGTKGAEVVELQEFLISKGFLSGNATGNFYSLTLAGVKAYQASVGVPNTGFVGSMTREKINGELALEVGGAEQAELTEVGSVSTPVVNDTQTLLKEQNLLLQRQLEAQQQVINAQKSQSDAQVVSTQLLNQINQNTLPVMEQTPEIVKELNVSHYSPFEIVEGVFPQSFSFKVEYKENGKYPDKIRLDIVAPEGSNMATGVIYRCDKKANPGPICIAQPGFTTYQAGTFHFTFKVGDFSKDYTIEAK